jgi:hypothetical protein
MTLAEIRAEVALIVQDAGFTNSEIDVYINQALHKVADMVALPSLKTIDTIATTEGQRYTTLSSGAGEFSGRMNKLLDVNGDRVKIYPDLSAFIEEHPTTEAGDVEYACLEGNVLWYHPEPATSQNLTAVLYNRPADLSADDDIPSEIPDILHRKLLVHGACYFIFDMIEDGIEGEKVNTISHYYHSFHDSYRATIKSGIKELQEWIGMRRHHYISSVWRY